MSNLSLLRPSLEAVPVSRSRLCSATLYSPQRVEVSRRASQVRLELLRHWASTRRELPLISRCDGVYTIDRPYYFFDAFDVGSRCTVIVAPSVSGGRPKLLYYTPIPIDEQLRTMLAALGVVSLIIAPNHEHVDIVASAKAVFPDATVLGPPYCCARWPHLPFDTDMFVEGCKTGR